MQGYPAVLTRGHEAEILGSVYEAAEPLDGPRVTELAGAARDLGLHVIFGPRGGGCRRLFLLLSRTI